jgi:hypothetical protein
MVVSTLPMPFGETRRNRMTIYMAFEQDGFADGSVTYGFIDKTDAATPEKAAQAIAALHPKRTVDAVVAESALHRVKITRLVVETVQVARVEAVSPRTKPPRAKAE